MPSSSGETFAIYNPNDETLVTDKVQVASEADIDAAVAAAKKAFPAWRDSSAAKRAGCMIKFAELMELNVDKLVSLESRAMGQPVSMAKRMILGAAAYWRYYAGWAGKVAGESFPPNEDGTYKIVQYEPLGVCAGICAWNGTHTLAAWKMGPAMATGNTFILKSSEKSPLATAAYGDMINEAGFPPGVINVVTGAGPVGAMLASHMQIAKIAFTGSAIAGRAVMAAAAKSNLKQVSLELGGKSPALIFDDADIDNAVEHSSVSFLRNSGQICYAASRVLVQEGIASKFIEAVKTAFENANKQMGDPSLSDTLFGPLADKKQFERVMGFLNDGKAEGLQYLVGGKRKGESGTFVEPTIILDPDLKSKVYTDEIFGPVISVKTFKTEEQAIEMANDTTYGLGCESSAFFVVSSSLTALRSDHLHRRHRASFARRWQDRGRDSRHQLCLRCQSANAVRRVQAERDRAREWRGRSEGVFAAEDDPHQYECAGKEVVKVRKHLSSAYCSNALGASLLCHKCLFQAVHVRVGNVLHLPRRVLEVHRRLPSARRPRGRYKAIVTKIIRPHVSPLPSSPASAISFCVGLHAVQGRPRHIVIDVCSCTPPLHRHHRAQVETS